MARIEDIERRLRQWARWRLMTKSGGGNYATTDMAQERVDGGGYDAPTVIPINDSEAALTEHAVQALEPDLRVAVFAVYIDGGPMRRKAQKVGVSEATIYLRVEQAHRRLSNWFADRAQQQREQRARVEALQAAARPPDIDIGPLKAKRGSFTP